MLPNLCSGLSLAYIGDAVYEVKVRQILLESGLTKVDDLHKHAIKFTKGENQAKIIRFFIENNLLSEKEVNIYKRGRNSHVKLTRKNISLSDYLDATGFEALIGYLYLSNEICRLNEIVNISLQMK